MSKRFLKIYVEITNSCNFNCSFCGKSKREIKFMTIEEFRKVANEVIKYTDLITLHIKGEPLLHPNLKEILDISNEVGLKVNITTNGSLISKNIEFLKNPCVRQLNISIHSVNVNNINEINISRESYLNDIFKSVKILKENNENLYISYRLWNLKNIEKNSENYDLIQSLEKEYNMTDLINVAKENLFVELGKGIFLNQDLEFKWPYMEDKVISDIGRCLGLKNQIGILSNGNVVPCCLDQDGNVLLGNIFKDTLENILNSDFCREIIKGFDENKIIPELCRRCTFREKFSK